jgi:hypothetical protein
MGDLASGAHQSASNIISVGLEYKSRFEEGVFATTKNVAKTHQLGAISSNTGLYGLV